MDAPSSADRKPAAIILDLDGLMLDTERLARKTWQCAAAAYGYAIDGALYARTIGRTPEDTGRIYVQALGSDFPYAQVRILQQHQMNEALDAKELAPMPGLAELLTMIDELKLDVGVATSSHRPSAERKLSAAGLDSRFPIVICGDDVTNGKPAPDIFLKTATRMEVAPHGCLVLEDSEPGAQAAHAAGMRVILVPDLAPPSEATRAICWRIVPSLEAVAPLLHDLCAEASRGGEQPR